MVEGYFLSKDGIISSKFEDGYFTVPADRSYSTIFNINNTTGNWNISGPIFSETHVHVQVHVGFTGVECSCSDVSVSSAATFDIQRTTAKGGSKINLTGHFISNSHAPGCFLALQSDFGSADVFRVSLRNDTSESFFDVIIGAPRSNYTLYVYDLEIGEHINTDPASTQDDKIYVTKSKF